ncbi:MULTISPECIES: hypothetical protein [unclassified Streptococcus]|nr:MULTISPECIES: hypothetical protein [unclassified Streptococcus]
MKHRSLTIGLSLVSLVSAAILLSACQGKTDKQRSPSTTSQTTSTSESK